MLDGGENEERSKLLFLKDGVSYQSMRCTNRVFPLSFLSVFPLSSSSTCLSVINQPEKNFHRRRVSIEGNHFLISLCAYQSGRRGFVKNKTTTTTTTHTL